MQMVGLNILVRIEAKNRTEFIQAFDLARHIEQLGEKRHYVELFEEVGEPNTFLWVEYWESDTSLSEYIQTIKFKSLMGAVKVLGELCSPSDHVRLYDIHKMA